MFGPLTVLVGGKPLPRLRSRKGNWLLALLALRPGQAVDRRWLAGCLWPDAPEAQAYASLRQSLADLRRALGDMEDRLEAPTAYTLRLDMAGVDLDVREFDLLAARSDTEALETAVALYRGPLLEGCTEEWVPAEREPRTQVYLNTLEALADRLRTQDPERAHGYLRRIVQQDPLRESAQRALMRSLAETGQLSEATQVYRDLRLYLRREMNADPDPATAALYQEIRNAGIARLQRPTPQVPRATIGAVPIPLTPLIGRQRETAEVLAHLTSARLVTLTGPGGIGKTRLSLQVAGLLAPDLADGAWFVDLAPIQSPDLVPQVVATLLEIHQTTGTPVLNALVEHLRDRAALLVLDNCEHVIGACAEVAVTLLQACPQLKILATSREALDIPGEVAWAVPSLDQPRLSNEAIDGKQPPAALLEYDAVRLLVDRILAQCPDFVVTRENAPDIVKICNRLDGIPLALELAAARARTLPVDQIAMRLDDCFRLLTGGSRTAMPRHQTLSALIDWSHELLGPPQQTLLRRLSIFADGWTLEAAEAVCADDEERTPPNKTLLLTSDVLDLLTQLVDKSLVVVEEGGRRFRLLETIRQYATARLGESGETTDLRVRHRRYYHALVQQVPRNVGNERTEQQALLARDHENFRAILEGPVADADAALDALQLATGLWRYCQEKRQYTDGIRWLERALERPDIGTPEIRAQAHNGLAVLLWSWGGNVLRAGEHLEQSLALYREIGDVEGAGHALNNLGLVAWMQGDMDRARRLHTECLEMRRPSEDKLLIGYSLYNLGLVECDDLAFDLARQHFNECLELSRSIEAPRFLGCVLDRLGYVAFLTGDREAATVLCRESLLIFRTQEDQHHIPISLNTLSYLAIDAGDYSAARAMLTESLILRQAARNYTGTVDSLNGFAALAAAESVPLRAARLWGAAETLSVKMNCPLARPEHAVRKHSMSAPRAQLGDSAFEAAMEAGRHLSMEQACALALEH
jgi:predicted ATPase/DNA-binding SARP family transcriptional activator